MIFHYFSQNESVILKMDTCTTKRNERNTHLLYDCRDIGGFLEAALVWKQRSPHPPKSVKNTIATCGKQCRSRDNRFV